MAKVSINIVAWNSMKYLPALLESIRAQTFADFSVLVIDNASTDGVIDFLRSHYSEIATIRNFNNLGFSGAHNQGIKYALSRWQSEELGNRYILVTNPDIILTPDFLDNLIHDADRYTNVGAHCGKLLRAIREGDGPLEETIKTNIIDSTGLNIYKSRRVVDRGAGEEDKGQYDSDRSIFGVSGALACYRASVLEASRVGEEYFDNDFFAYKEDIDLSWRIRLCGFDIRYAPRATAYHFRRARTGKKDNFWETLKNRRFKSKVINFYSYRNHLLAVFKNDHWINLFLHLPLVLFYELAKFFSALFFEPATFRAIPSFFRLLPKILTKRKTVMAKCRIKAKEMRKWFI